jgi:signal transduction histidine kinase
MTGRSVGPAAALGTYSLRRRLAVLIFALLGLLGGGFAWMAYHEVQAALRTAGTERIASAATQVADLLNQSAAARIADTRRLANDPAWQEAILSGEAAARDEIPAAVQSALSRSPLVSVWVYDDAGRPPRRLGAGSEAGTELAAGAPRLPLAGTSPLSSEAGRIWYHTTVPIEPADSGRPRRYLAIQRPLSSSQAADLIERLIGPGAELKFGNASGDVWTNLSVRTTAPPVAGPGVATPYTGDAGEKWIGIAVPVADTPWVLWVAVAEHTMLGAAQTLLRQMLPVTLVLMALGAFAVYGVSGRVTGPLESLTLAAEAIAAGDYSRRVSVERHDEIGRLGTAFNVMAARVGAAHDSLERRVAERTRELEDANRELEAFSYSVSHDLRSPLRHIAGFAALLGKHGAGLDQQGQRYLATISQAAAHMGRLVDDLLGFSRMARAEVLRGEVDLACVVEEVVEEVKRESPTRRIVWKIGTLPVVVGDPAMLRLAIVNLVQNAYKYTGKREVAEIEIGMRPQVTGEQVLYVKDNGAGFDMAYAGKLFGVFQRLHRSEDFEGTGIGLANVRRIVQRHGGRTWAEGAVDAGATFYLALPAEDEGVAT